ncbi:DoxX family membrane protein [Halopelagius longus]|uniref:DoxX family membrane protein n=1 Tax=Halopelagius longus TaxID=1236180 RepID=A0A1H1AVS7_9EURY|nr:DoxX family membrane protein [Halopelagius longus]RDI70519.1 DoxX family membrane protein [Halopelagius longus]SDQ43256.1 DoxX protein [Halopelagius longus]
MDARRFADDVRDAAAFAPDAATVARVGLGLMLFAAGVHKLLDPAAWAVYVVEWLVPWLVVSPVAFMLVNGALEIGFGAAILADRYTALASAVAAVSLSATCLYLAAVFILEGGLFGDVLARDIGLTGLAWSVLLASLRGD